MLRNVGSFGGLADLFTRLLHYRLFQSPSRVHSSEAWKHPLHVAALGT